MDVRKYIVTIFVLLTFPITAFGYSDETTHPALTKKIVEKFNELHPLERISEKHQRVLERGSIAEDEDWRFMRHFFDPVYNTGLTFGTIANRLRPWPATPVWAVDTQLQAQKDSDHNEKDLHFSAETDHSWDRAVYEYIYGDKGRAFYSLGHILHLVQDMTVPPHVRDDPHPPVGELGSVYEAHTKDISPDTIGDIDYIPIEIEYGNVSDLLREIAVYVNGNFYSKDTTPDKTGRYKKVPEGDIEVVILNDGTRGNFIRGVGEEVSPRLARLLIGRDILTSEEYKKYYLDDVDNLVLKDYWRLLSQEALRYGVAALELFFRDVRKEIESGKLYALQFPENPGRSGLGNLAALSISLNPSRFQQYDEPLGPVVLVGPIETETDVPQFDLAALADQLRDLESELVAIVVDDVEEAVDPPAEEDGHKQDVIEDRSKLFAIPSGAVGGGGAPLQPYSSEEVPVEIPSSDPVVDEDTIPPTLSVEVVECSDSFSSQGCLIATSTITVLHSSQDDDLLLYEVVIDSQLATTTATSTTLSFASSATNIGVRALDASGNYSPQHTQMITVASAPVIISEVAWGGTESSSSDEWIELYNTSNFDIDLSDWILYASSTLDPYIELNGDIPAHGYFTVERKNTDDEDEITESPIPSISAGQWVSFGSGLSNSGEQLLLARASTTIDVTPEVDVCRGWCAGSNDISMERLVFDSTSANAWGDWSDLFTYATDTEDNQIQGTPDGRNSNTYQLPVVQGGDNLTITADNSPYVIKSTWGIPRDSVVTLDPGVVIKVNSFTAGVGVSGTLITNGTEAQPVVITALADDEHGGDTQRDDSLSLSKGLWRTLDFYAGSDASVLTHTHVRYGGTYSNGYTPLNRAAVKVSNSSPTFDNVTVAYAKQNGMVLKDDSSATVKNSTFHDNGSASQTSYALYISEGSPVVQNNTFTENETALASFVSGIQADGNIFNGNKEPVIIDRPANDGYISGSTGSNNDSNGIRYYTLLTGTTTLKKNTLPYYFPSVLEVPGSSSLVLKPGVHFALRNSPIRVSGRIEILGTQDNPVVISDEQNDDVFGDIFGDGTSTIDIGSDSGIWLRSGATSKIEHARLTYLKQAIEYENSSVPIDLSNVYFGFNDVALDIPVGATSTRFESVVFEDNTTTSTNPLP